MTDSQLHGGRFRAATSSFVRVVLATLSAGGTCFATGFFGPRDYLSRSEERIQASPEFYWEWEVKRLAKDFHPPETLHLTKMPDALSLEDKVGPLLNTTGEADVKDFAAALQQGELKPGDPAQATAQHQAARDFIAATDDKQSADLPEEFASEFSDYHRGAFAYRLGKEHWQDARTAWEALLKRPAAERHYRSVWAAFMLGKIAMKTGDYPAAATWMQKTRAWARDGFADSLGMAADSYGWEGRCEWKQNHPALAATLFLTQLALGDDSAVVSLKALIPDRTPVDGMLNYGPEPDDLQVWSAQQKAAAERKAQAGLKAAAADPLLRRLVTAHILAAAGNPIWYDNQEKSAARCAHWLTVIQEAKLETMQDAEYLGWIAYDIANYKAAAHWLDLAKGDTPASNWLRAKLQRRAGQLNEAAASMQRAWQALVKPSGQAGSEKETIECVDDGYEESFAFPTAASGDFALIRLARGEFVQAMDTFLKGGLWTDAAYVAERVLTADELKAYIDEYSKAFAKGAPSMAYLLGRRLVREDRYAEAAHYLPPPYDKVLEKYVQALSAGADAALPKRQRATAWLTAAWLARYDGMELMGTEVAPDGFESEGAFSSPDVAKQRQLGKYQQTSYQDSKELVVTKPMVLPPSKDELQRLAKNKLSPNVRYHYRIIAASLALKGAVLLDDNSDELADVLNTAGLWVMDRDEKLGDRIFQLLQQRCPKAKLGKAAIAKHGFVHEKGPWNMEQQTVYDALHKELGIANPQQ